MTGRPQIYKEPRVPRHLRIPKSLDDRVVAAAEYGDVSYNFIVTKALERYFKALNSKAVK